MSHWMGIIFVVQSWHTMSVTSVVSSRLSSVRVPVSGFPRCSITLLACAACPIHRVLFFTWLGILISNLLTCIGYGTLATSGACHQFSRPNHFRQRSFIRDSSGACNLVYLLSQVFQRGRSKAIASKFLQFWCLVILPKDLFFSVSKTGKANTKVIAKVSLWILQTWMTN